LSIRELAALNIAGVTPLMYRELKEKLGDDSQVLRAALAHKGMEEKEALNAADKEMVFSDKSHVKMLGMDDPVYPAPLRYIPDPPYIIYVKGGLKQEDLISIAIVGSRNPSVYGRSQAENFSAELSALGFCIVSGLAKGVDSAAHGAVLKRGNRTLAVLGSGIMKIYPDENRGLAEKICESGALISEFPLLKGPEKWNFPRRNRVISGLSLGSLVIEAGEKSGALITTKYALEQGREVFALPGNITSVMSKGTNGLIKAGAKLVESAEDIISELSGVLPDGFLNKTGQAELPVVSLLEDENRVFSAVEGETHVDDIAKTCGMQVSKVLSVLVGLELKGYLKQYQGKIFVKSVK